MTSFLIGFFITASEMGFHSLRWTFCLCPWWGAFTFNYNSTKLHLVVNLFSESDWSNVNSVLVTHSWLAQTARSCHHVACPVSVCCEEVSPVVHRKHGGLVCASSEAELLTCSCTCANQVTVLNSTLLTEMSQCWAWFVRTVSSWLLGERSSAARLAALTFLPEHGP